MTDKQKKMAYAMLIDGFSLHEAAEATRTEEKALEAEFKWMLPKEPKKPVKKREPEAYPNLAKWLKESGMYWTDLAKLIDKSSYTASMLRRGRFDIRKKEIDIILELTGMTYEECFAKEKAPEDAATSIKG